ncbi:MAG: hypothetical protein V2B14_06435 [bacterium]
MKKVYLALIILLNFVQIAYAQETSDYNDNPYFYNQYEYTKPVTPQEFNAAVETINKYQKTKNKKKKKNKNKDNAPLKKIKKIPEIPGSPDALLRLPFDVYINESVLQSGFYLVDKIKKDDKYFLRFKQGYKIITEIEAKIDQDIKENYPEKNNVTIKNFDNDTLKINYEDKDVRLKIYLSTKKK